MIVNFWPSNLGLFGFLLQAHARAKEKRGEEKAGEKENGRGKEKRVSFQHGAQKQFNSNGEKTENAERLPNLVHMI